MRSKLVIVTAAIILGAAVAGADDQACPCVPLSYVWLATACDSWNCAASALVLANGDEHVMALPAASQSYKWVVLRRVVAGSATQSPDAPFVVEPFTNMNDGSARYNALSQNVAPLLVTAQGGDVLVISLRDPEPRPQRTTGR